MSRQFHLCPCKFYVLTVYQPMFQKFLHPDITNKTDHFSYYVCILLILTVLLDSAINEMVFNETATIKTATITFNNLGCGSNYTIEAGGIFNDSRLAGPRLRLGSTTNLLCENITTAVKSKEFSS